MNNTNSVSEPWKNGDGFYFCQERNANGCPDGLCGTGKCPIDAVSIACGVAKAGNLAEAERMILKVTESDPDYACAWANLGALQFERGDSQAARISSLRALRLDSGFDMAQVVLRKANRAVENIRGRREMDMYRYLMDAALSSGGIDKKFDRNPYPIDLDRGKRIGDLIIGDLKAKCAGKDKAIVDLSEDARKSLIMCIAEGFKVALAHKVNWANLSPEVMDFLKEQDPTCLEDSWRTAISLFAGEICDGRKKMVPPRGMRIGSVLLAYAHLALCEVSEWQKRLRELSLIGIGSLGKACQGVYCFGVALGESMDPPWNAAY